MAPYTPHTLPPPFTPFPSTSNASGEPPQPALLPASAPLPPPRLVTQGAESLLFRTAFLTLDTACALKYRPAKAYRHAALDRRLTKARLLAEARSLVKCRREGVRVPAVLGADWVAGWLAMEWIPGLTIRACLDHFLHQHHHDISSSSAPATADPNPEHSAALWGLMARVGRAVGRLHEIGVVHGDLTTSNLMIRPPPPATTIPAGLEPSDESGERISAATGARKTDEETIVAAEESEDDFDATALLQHGTVWLIDFGLAAQTPQDEDRAVDLYVLERAFGSTHPAAEELFQEVLRVYGESYKGAKTALRRLEDVRARGRKRSMIG
ncbi:kinase-like domain-containing protein [Lineolata rhizophorae]|uniref:EKC/KEOPS complex subunit BUD32 n=1 Tax=Lineolata rhizophorae TaxID=578093 RepID=A0A6A6PEP3_9PEZI|nr:kinase-like domain-containing protein [Lineolata rhizophorae]